MRDTFCPLLQMARFPTYGIGFQESSAIFGRLFRAMEAGYHIIFCPIGKKKNYQKEPSIYDVRKILGFFDPLPPLSTFGTDLQY